MTSETRQSSVSGRSSRPANCVRCGGYVTTNSEGELQCFMCGRPVDVRPWEPPVRCEGPYVDALRATKTKGRGQEKAGKVEHYLGGTREG